jgi:hypothetical protein
MYNSSVSLIINIKPTAQEKFRTAAMLFHFVYKKDLNECYIFFLKIYYRIIIL